MAAPQAAAAAAIIFVVLAAAMVSCLWWRKKNINRGPVKHPKSQEFSVLSPNRNGPSDPVAARTLSVLGSPGVAASKGSITAIFGSKGPDIVSLTTARYMEMFTPIAVEARHASVSQRSTPQQQQPNPNAGQDSYVSRSQLSMSVRAGAALSPSHHSGVSVVPPETRHQAPRNPSSSGANQQQQQQQQQGLVAGGDAAAMQQQQHLGSAEAAGHLRSQFIMRKSISSGAIHADGPAGSYAVAPNSMPTTPSKLQQQTGPLQQQHPAEHSAMSRTATPPMLQTMHSSGLSPQQGVLTTCGTAATSNPGLSSLRPSTNGTDDPSGEPSSRGGASTPVPSPLLSHGHAISRGDTGGGEDWSGVAPAAPPPLGVRPAVMRAASSVQHFTVDLLGDDEGSMGERARSDGGAAPTSRSVARSQPGHASPAGAAAGSAPEDGFDEARGEAQQRPSGTWRGAQAMASALNSVRRIISGREGVAGPVSATSVSVLRSSPSVSALQDCVPGSQGVQHSAVSLLQPPSPAMLSGPSMRTRGVIYSRHDVQVTGIPLGQLAVARGSRRPSEAPMGVVQAMQAQQQQQGRVGLPSVAGGLPPGIAGAYASVCGANMVGLHAGGTGGVSSPMHAATLAARITTSSGAAGGGSVTPRALVQQPGPAVLSSSPTGRLARAADSMGSGQFMQMLAPNVEVEEEEEEGGGGEQRPAPLQVQAPQSGAVAAEEEPRYLGVPGHHLPSGAAALGIISSDALLASHHSIPEVVPGAGGSSTQLPHFANTSLLSTPAEAEAALRAACRMVAAGQQQQQQQHRALLAARASRSVVAELGTSQQVEAPVSGVGRGMRPSLASVLDTAGSRRGSNKSIDAIHGDGSVNAGSSWKGLVSSGPCSGTAAVVGSAGAAVPEAAGAATAAAASSPQLQKLHSASGVPSPLAPISSTLGPSATADGSRQRGWESSPQIPALQQHQQQQHQRPIALSTRTQPLLQVQVPDMMGTSLGSTARSTSQAGVPDDGLGSDFYDDGGSDEHDSSDGEGSGEIEFKYDMSMASHAVTPRPGTHRTPGRRGLSNGGEAGGGVSRAAVAISRSSMSLAARISPSPNKSQLGSVSDVIAGRGSGGPSKRGTAALSLMAVSSRMLRGAQAEGAPGPGA